MFIDETPVPKPGDWNSAEVRKQQAEFQEFFGDFRARHAMQFWLGPAPQGEWVGLYFRLEDGTEHKIAIPYVWWKRFGAEYVAAMNSAAERMETAYSSKGKA